MIAKTVNIIKHLKIFLWIILSTQIGYVDKFLAVIAFCLTFVGGMDIICSEFFGYDRVFFVFRR